LSTKIQLACLLLGTLLTLPGMAHAGTDLIILTAAGEAYNGEPFFRVLANEKTIGVGKIPNALDTSAGSHLTDVNENNVARFVFTVPSLEDIEVLDIEFFNDAWAGEGKPGDRNLYVIGLTLSMIESTSKPLHIRTVDFGPASFKPQTPKQEGVTISQQWAKLATNGRLRLQRPAGGWLSQPMISSEPEKKGAITGSLPPVQKKKATDEAPAAAEQVIVDKSTASEPEKKGAIAGILARLKKKKAANAEPMAKEEVSTKAKTTTTKPAKTGAITGSLPPVQKKKAANAEPQAKTDVTAKSGTPAESKTTDPESPPSESEGQAKSPNYSRYALPREKCRRIGEKGTDRLC
jgi:predicted xylan-binding protein with Ca-dependent carbohydrate-binding module